MVKRCDPHRANRLRIKVRLEVLSPLAISYLSFRDVRAFPG